MNIRARPIVFSADVPTDTRLGLNVVVRSFPSLGEGTLASLDIEHSTHDIDDVCFQPVLLLFFFGAHRFRRPTWFLFDAVRYLCL